MARIETIEVVIADVPTIRPHVLAMTTMMSQAVVLVFLARSDGVVGVGEATTIGGLVYGDESPESIKVNIETYCTPIVLAGDANDPAEIMATLDRHVVGNRFAKCAIETALFDALGRAEGKVFGDYFGERLHDRLPVAWTLASGNTAQDVEEGEAMLAVRRHRDFKLKIGTRDVVQDCGHVAAIARAFEGRASIRVDVNQHWSRADAKVGLALLQEAGVEMAEQPLSATDVEGMRAIAERFDIAVMADEALTGPASAARFVAESAADAFSLKITQSGGPTKAREVAQIAGDASIDLYGGTMLEGGIGTAASAHLFATLPEMRWGTELFGPLLMTEEILEQPLEYGDFGLAVPTGLGLGVTVDRKKLARFARH